MVKRNIQVLFRLTKAEQQELQKRAIHEKPHIITHNTQADDLAARTSFLGEQRR